MQQVCIQGLGFVGAAMAVAVASVRDGAGAPVFAVAGIDQPTPAGRERIEILNAGKFPFATMDEGLTKATATAKAVGNLRATDDIGVFAEADVIVVDINLDIDRSGDVPQVNFAPFRQAIRAIGDNVRPGALIIVETTVPPGTCDRIVVPELRAALESRGIAGDDLLLAHSYERVMPGENYLESITHFWRVFAGATAEAAEACEKFLSEVIDTDTYPLTELDSLIASETAKVMENSYRATNIAFVEEWGRFAEAVGIDLFQVIDAIRVRPTHNNIRQPGFGVGGYCLTKDPLFAGVAVRDLFGRGDLTFPFSEAAVKTNEAMPLVSIKRLQQLLGGDLDAKRVLVMGVTYREDVADTRHSPAEMFVIEARKRGAEVIPHDPLVDHWRELDIAVRSALPPSESIDAIVFAVPHRAYRELDLQGWLAAGRPAVLDANNVLSAEQRQAVTDSGCAFAAIGRGEP